MSKVFIALQANEETRPVIEAIEADNPHAVVNREPAMVKIDAEHMLTINRESIEELMGRPYDLQELQINLITLSGNMDEDEDSLTLTWNE
ncbi:phenol 2-monooxygenase P2 subunit [Raineyella antarctica]|uniref:Phenol 2-monooxygenase P2 subunit n=1 Tax=Raineyella antarctica TaxID=1577474 RepID=A0A1G6GHY5_9ACTN|nr:MmoB/DmpM family protein [Raineyella antarctica]SDB81554.1 phenol 2-monooxygenase P2 subunit [Raineyella antarctica]